MDDFPMYNIWCEWYGTWYSILNYEIRMSITEELDDYISKLALFGHSDQRDVELPTLLHFSAKYGLKKLTSTLLQCPGALQAYSIANKNGDYPNTLAERSGFPDLRQFMDDYVVSAWESLCKFKYLCHINSLSSETSWCFWTFLFLKWLMKCGCLHGL